MELLSVASLATGRRSLERRACRHWRFRWASSGWSQGSVHFPRVGESGSGTCEHEAIGGALHAAATIGQRTTRGCELEHARTADRSSGAFRTPSYVALRPERGRTLGRARRAEPAFHTTASAQQRRERSTGTAISVG